MCRIRCRIVLLVHCWSFQVMNRRDLQGELCWRLSTSVLLSWGNTWFCCCCPLELDTNTNNNNFLFISFVFCSVCRRRSRPCCQSWSGEIYGVYQLVYFPAHRLRCVQYKSFSRHLSGSICWCWALLAKCPVSNVRHFSPGIYSLWL